MGIPYVYLLLDFDQLGFDDAQLPEVIAEVEGLGFAGLNVTHPFKQIIIEHLHDLSPEAAAIGAVNTVLLGGGRRVGHNTDSWGFAESFCEELSGVPLGSVVQFGGGGRCGKASLESQASDRHDCRCPKGADTPAPVARALRPELAAIDAIGGLLSDADGIVNATPKRRSTPVCLLLAPAGTASLGCRDRLFSARYRVAQVGPEPRVQDAGGNGNGRLPGGEGV